MKLVCDPKINKAGNTKLVDNLNEKTINHSN